MQLDLGRHSFHSWWLLCVSPRENNCMFIAGLTDTLNLNSLTYVMCGSNSRSPEIILLNKHTNLLWNIATCNVMCKRNAAIMGAWNNTVNCMFVSFHENIGSNIISSLLVVHYVNYTTNYNKWIWINYLSGSILQLMWAAKTN